VKCVRFFVEKLNRLECGTPYYQRRRRARPDCEA
jgi:hypothetical protein